MALLSASGADHALDFPANLQFMLETARLTQTNGLISFGLCHRRRSFPFETHHARRAVSAEFDNRYSIMTLLPLDQLTE